MSKSNNNNNNKIKIKIKIQKKTFKQNYLIKINK